MPRRSPSPLNRPTRQFTSFSLIAAAAAAATAAVCHTGSLCLLASFLSQLPRLLLPTGTVYTQGPTPLSEKTPSHPPPPRGVGRGLPATSRFLVHRCVRNGRSEGRRENRTAVFSLAQALPQQLARHPSPARGDPRGNRFLPSAVTVKRNPGEKKRRALDPSPAFNRDAGAPLLKQAVSYLSSPVETEAVPLAARTEPRLLPPSCPGLKLTPRDVKTPPRAFYQQAQRGRDVV